MKAIILAGGFGTRISEETNLKPKPMLEIGGKPILWHIMKIYSSHGINDFIICCGYKGYVIKEYFSNYMMHNSDMTFDYQNNSIEFHDQFVEPWKVSLIDTGQDTMTGGRLKRVSDFIENDETFCMTYGDGVSDINITDLINFHTSSKKIATLTAVKPPGRFGALKISENIVNSFEEKPQGDGAWINGGFFVLHKKVLDLIDNDETVWEDTPLKNLALKGELSAYKHDGFWQPMDTLRDKIHLNNLWEDSPPWKKW